MINYNARSIFSAIKTSIFTLGIVLINCHADTEKNYAHTIQRPDGSLCRYYFDASNTQGNFSIIAVLQGSETKSASQFIPFIDPEQYKELNAAMLIIEKPGITESTNDLQEYLRLNSLTQRAQDYDLVLNYLRSTMPEWNNRLVTCGISEGGTVAAYIGARRPETVGIVMFSSGCGMTLREEIVLLESKKNARTLSELYQKYSTISYIKFMLLLSKFFPQSVYAAYGETNTLKWWHAIADYNPATDLSNLSIPLYLAHGSADTNCPVESAQALVTHFNELGKTNLHYRQYDGYDHNFNDQHEVNHWNEVIEVAVNWIKATVKN